MEELAEEVLLPTEKLLLQIENLELKKEQEPVARKQQKAELGQQSYMSVGCVEALTKKRQKWRTGLDVTSVNFGFTGHVPIFVKNPLLLFVKIVMCNV